MASKRYMNTRSMIATPTTGSPLTVTGITNFGIDFGISLQSFAGDADRGPTLIVQDFSDMTWTFTTADLSACAALGVSWRGSLSAISKDARNQTSVAGSGDIAWTFANAVISANSFQSGFRAFGAANIAFRAEMPDGFTPPLSFVITA